MPTPLVLALARQLLVSGAGKRVIGGILKGIESKHITPKQAKGLLEKLRNPEVSTKEVLDKKTIEKLMSPTGQTKAPGTGLPDDWKTELLKAGVIDSKKDVLIGPKQPVSVFSKIADKGKFPKPRINAKEKEELQLVVAKTKNKADIANLPKSKPAKPKKVLTDEEAKALKAERAKALKEIKAEKVKREGRLREEVSQRDAKAWLDEAENPVIGKKSIYEKIADAHNTKNKPELNRLLNELAEKKAIASGKLRVKSTKPLPKNEPQEPRYGSEIEKREYARAQEKGEEKDFTESKYRLQEPDEEEVLAKSHLGWLKESFDSIDNELKIAAGPYIRALERFTKEERYLIENGLRRFTKKQEPEIYKFQKLFDAREELLNSIAYRRELLDMPTRATLRDAEYPFYSNVRRLEGPTATIPSTKSGKPVTFTRPALEETPSGKSIVTNEGELLSKGGYKLEDPIEYYVTKSGKRVQADEGRKWTSDEIEKFYERQVASGIKKHDEQQAVKVELRRAAAKKKAEIAAKKADAKAGIVREKPKSQLLTKKEYEATKKNTTTDSSQAKQLTQEEREAFIARLIGRNLPLG